MLMNSASALALTAGSVKPLARYLLVAQGGRGGFCDVFFGGAGGGGGGGVIERFDEEFSTPGSFMYDFGIPEDRGGAGAVVQNAAFNGLTAIIGGRGGQNSGILPTSGGSGGGGAVGTTSAAGTPGQGYAGSAINSLGYMGKGGGGAGGIGGTGLPQGGNGGPGHASDITGTMRYYGAGGGGGNIEGQNVGQGGSSGVGGRGSAQGQTPADGLYGDSDTGSGGGGAGRATDDGENYYGLYPGAGAFGALHFRYPKGSIEATGGIITEVGGDILHSFLAQASPPSGRNWQFDGGNYGYKNCQSALHINPGENPVIDTTMYRGVGGSMAVVIDLRPFKAGDLVVLYAAWDVGNVVQVPAGWARNNLSGQIGSYNASICQKVLTSTDITAGFATFTRFRYGFLVGWRGPTSATVVVQNWNNTGTSRTTSGYTKDPSHKKTAYVYDAYVASDSLADPTGTVLRLGRGFVHSQYRPKLFEESAEDANPTVPSRTFSPTVASNYTRITTLELR